MVTRFLDRLIAASAAVVLALIALSVVGGWP